MDINTCCPEKVVSADIAVAHIKRGSRVFVGTGCGEPQHLIRAMVRNEQLQDIMVYQMMSSTFADYLDDPGFLGRFNLKLFLSARRCARRLSRVKSIISQLIYLEYRVCFRVTGSDWMSPWFK